MKKFTLALMAALIHFPSIAQIQVERPDIQAPSHQMNIFSKTGQTFTPAYSKRDKFGKPDSNRSNLPRTNFPDQEKSYYTVVMESIEQDNSNFIVSHDTGNATILVKQEGDNVSLLSPFKIYSEHESRYIDGVVDGDKLKFNLPVTIDENGPWSFALSVLRYNADDHTYYPVDDTENVLELQISPDGVLSYKSSDQAPVITDNLDESSFPETILGIAVNNRTNGEFIEFFYGTWDTEFSPIVLNTVPEGLVFEEWSLGAADPMLKYDLPCWNRLCGVAIDGNDIYLKGVCNLCDDSVIKGTFENGVATFEGIQNAGFVNKYDMICYVVATEASFNGTQIEVGNDIPLTMVLDNETKTLKSENTMLWCVVDPETRSYLNTWFEPMCIANTQAHLDANPEAPTLQIGTNFSESNMGYLFNYYIPNINLNGCVLDKAKMYYNIYVNGELYTFNKDQYFVLAEDMTDIPADYSDNMFFVNLFSMGVDIYGFWLMYETEKVYTIGVKSFYTGSDGEIYASELIEFDPGFFVPEAVNEIEADCLIGAEEYYTIDGKRVQNPSSGLFLKVSKLTDGSRKVEKIIF